MLNPPIATSSRVHSVNVSGPLRAIAFAGHTVTTGFFKTPTNEEVYAHRLGLNGDAQGDLTVHGGLDKAVYFYPREHYAEWETLLNAGSLPAGSFGENITSEGLLETTLNIGDVLQIGSARLQVLQPRSPCYKLQIRFNRPDMTALFYHHGKPGWYASVLQTGSFKAGDQIEVVSRAPENITVSDIWRYSARGDIDDATARRIEDLTLLPDFWKMRVRR